ncbi:unnamed protein product, partial [marine sediment metagenome]
PDPKIIRAIPGKSVIHHADEIKALPSDIIDPHSGIGGCTPNPKKLKEAPVSIHITTSEAAKTIDELSVFGRICLNKILELLYPNTFVA